MRSSDDVMGSSLKGAHDDLRLAIGTPSGGKQVLLYLSTTRSRGAVTRTDPRCNRVLEPLLVASMSEFARQLRCEGRPTESSVQAKLCAIVTGDGAHVETTSLIQSLDRLQRLDRQPFPLANSLVVATV